MVESRCGILCNECEYRDKMNCEGCLAIDKPFWGDSCPVKSCCEGRKHEHCGQCPDFPCELLTEFAYDKEQGDNGKRIAICRAWSICFDAEGFITAVAKQDADTLLQFFDPDAVICWHDSNEQFTVPEYIRANCEYPGSWIGEIQRIEKMSDGIVVVTKISSDEITVHVTAFIKLADGKICQLDEYYSDCGEAPKWRREMNIGKPISS